MLQVREVMTRDVHVVSPETTLREVAELFSAKHISGAPVMAGHHIIGLARSEKAAAARDR